MTAKTLLERIIKLRKAIAYRNTKIDALISQAQNISARMTGMPHNPSADPSPMATAICKKIDLEREIAELQAERESLIQKIDLLENDVLSQILNLRYVQEERWEEIATSLGYSEVHIFRLHRQAITLLDAILKDDSK